LKYAILSMLVLMTGCLESNPDDGAAKTVFTTCSVADQLQNKCTRFMDRKIYLSFSLGQDPSKNNEFQKITVREALRDIEESTNLGSGYFSFEEIDPTFIEPIIEQTVASEFRSFIQILPDGEFNEIAESFGFIPDQNAITVINAANKRQFYMLLRASCFNSNDTVCTNDGAATMGEPGVKALIARQLGVLTGIPLDCSLNERTMCAEFPSDLQWSSAQKRYWSASFNNALETIGNNPSFYEEFFIE